MTALSAPRVTSPREKVVRRAAVQLAAGVKAYQGAAAMIITSGTGKGYYAPADAGKVGDVEGRFLETVDNTLGAAGAASAQIEFGHDRELVPFVNDSGAPLAAADRGGPAYALDDQTVSATVSTAIMGRLYDVDANNVAWVEVGAAFDVPDSGLSDVAPVNPSSTVASAGSSDEAARRDHKHQITVATTVAEGLMSAAQCLKLTHLAAPVVGLFDKAAADGNASDAFAEHAVYIATGNETFSALKFMPDAALTAHDTNYATLTVRKRDGAGGAASTVASVTTKITGGSGDWDAFEAVDLGTVTGGALAAGTVLTFIIAKSGGGVVVPAGKLYGVAAVA